MLFTPNLYRCSASPLCLRHDQPQHLTLTHTAGGDRTGSKCLGRCSTANSAGLSNQNFDSNHSSSSSCFGLHDNAIGQQPNPIELQQAQHLQQVPYTQPQQKQHHPQQQSSMELRSAPSTQLLTCRRCLQRFSTDTNTAVSCTYHPCMYTGGEVAKAIGFVRESSSPEHQLGAVVGRTGLMRFWDCCGAAAADAPGCKQGHHVSFDDELNETMGWSGLD